MMVSQCINNILVVRKMKWNQKVDDKTREKIDVLLREFDKFILGSHDGGSAPEDKAIVKEWKNFKSVIEKDPTNIESLHAYINAIPVDQRQQVKVTKNTLGVSRSQTNIQGRSSSSKHQISFQVNKHRMRKSVKDLVESIMRNNKEVLKLDK